MMETEMAEIDRDVDLRRPAYMTYYHWYASSARAAILAQAHNKYATQKYVEYIAERLAALKD